MRTAWRLRRSWRRWGLKILVTQTDSLDQVEATWTQLGEATGKTSVSSLRAGLRISRTRERNRQRLQNEPRLRTLIMVWKSPWMGQRLRHLYGIAIGVLRKLTMCWPTSKPSGFASPSPPKPLAEDYKTVSKTNLSAASHPRCGVPPNRTIHLY